MIWELHGSFEGEQVMRQERNCLPQSRLNERIAVFSQRQLRKGGKRTQLGVKPEHPSGVVAREREHLGEGCQHPVDSWRAGKDQRQLLQHQGVELEQQLVQLRNGGLRNEGLSNGGWRQWRQVGDQPVDLGTRHASQGAARCLCNLRQKRGGHTGSLKQVAEDGKAPGCDGRSLRAQRELFLENLELVRRSVVGLDEMQQRLEDQGARIGSREVELVSLWRKWVLCRKSQASLIGSSSWRREDGRFE